MASVSKSDGQSVPLVDWKERVQTDACLYQFHQPINHWAYLVLNNIQGEVKKAVIVLQGGQ